MTLFINSKRCYLRRLDLKDDLSKYLYWMQTPANNPFILSAKLDFELSQLREFITNCNTRQDVMLLGIFTNIDDVHIGNIKFSNSLTNLKNMGEGGFHYTPIPKINGNIKLVGHFQSEKYFIEHRDKILELFEIDNTNYLRYWYCSIEGY